MKPDPVQQIPTVRPDRPCPTGSWPSKHDHAPPIWCSVDLRDGNQALIEPMDAERKLRMFELLVKMGYKEIEIGFPAASQTDFDFVRQLIEEELIPDDVTVQVLTQAREPLIRAHLRVARGRRSARSCTCTTRRRRRSGASCSVSTATGIVDIAVTAREAGPRLRARAAGNRLDLPVLAGELHRHRARLREGDLRRGHRRSGRRRRSDQIILNLPATVEMATPNIYADQIEWMCRHLARRDSVIAVGASAQRPRLRRRRGRARA